MTFIESALLVALGASIGKFLLKEYVGGFGEGVGGGVLDFAKDKIKDALSNYSGIRVFHITMTVYFA